MELLKLSQTTYKPEYMVEGHSALVWTERYQNAGEFVFTTSKIEETIRGLPIGSLVSLRDTNEVMIVETYDLSQNEDGHPTLHVKGRSFTTFLENRIAVDFYRGGMTFGVGDPREGKRYAWYVYRTNWNDSDAATFLIQESLVSGNYGVHPYADPRPEDTIPNFEVSNLVGVNRREYSRYFDRKDIYSNVVDLIKTQGSGIRTDRPGINDSKMRMVIYGGVDRHQGQNANTRVVFDFKAGHVYNVRYLKSNKTYRNIVELCGESRHSGTPNKYPPNYDVPILSGLNKRDILVDKPEITGETWADGVVPLATMEPSERLKHPVTEEFDCDVSPTIPYVYKRDYYLGDFVTVNYNYGINARLRVTEYIRSENRDGEIGYPSLSAII